ncbi:MAG: hypothetical protein HKO81_02255 [Flavobacteriaceae bacterium]|nr:hypothetical protein [Bacteroidia bacterium]NNL15448.1 hypothetical protein [Flavobacteriaceae bacterium]
MNYILRIISFIFHPLLMPLLAVTFYFSKAPRYIPDPIIKGKILSLFILTILLPILLFYLLKSIRLTESIYLENVKHRIIPLILNCFITILILIKIVSPNEFLELYFFFVGVLLSTITCLILALISFKASIHMIASGGVLMFFIALSIHFSINISGSIAIMCLIVGAIATSRLHLKAHTQNELLIGLLIGVIPQLILLNYWL